MKRLLKVLSWLLGALVLLIAAAILILPRLIDPNDYRDEIDALFERETGRTLLIQGDLRLSVFPWLGVEVGRAQVGNAPGFGPEPFLAFEEAKVKVRLLPLLRREVRLDTLHFDGLRLNLLRRTDGTTNWEDLTKEGEAPEGARRPGDRLSSLAIGGIVLRDALVVWDDRRAGRRVEARSLALETGAIDFDSPLPLSVDADFAVSNPRTAGHLRLRAVAWIDPEGSRYRLEGVEMQGRMESPLVPGGPFDLTLQGEAAADLEQETATAKGLRLDLLGTRVEGNADLVRLLTGPRATGAFAIEVREGKRLFQILAPMLPEGTRPEAFDGSRAEGPFELDLAGQRLALPRLLLRALGVRLTGELEGKSIIDAPAFAGRLASDPFAPRDLLRRFGIEPRTSDPKVLSSASLATRFDFSSRAAALSDLRLRLDETTMAGRLSLDRAPRPLVRYDLTLDRLDLDRYLPPPGEETAEREGGDQGAALPAGPLRRYDLEGRLRVGSLKAANLRLADLAATLKGREGRLRFDPLRARLYEGSLAGDLRLDLRGDTPLWTMQPRLQGIQVGPLLRDLAGKPYVTGRARVTADLTARGIELSGIRRTLSGKATFAFEEGAVNGINIAQMVRSAYARYQGRAAPEEETRKTDFSELAGTVTIADGVVSNGDLAAKSPLLRLTGKGSVNLVSEAIDYRADATLVASLEGQGGRELAELKGIPIPIAITGTLGNPRFNLPIGAIFEEKARQALDAEKQRLQRRLQEEQKRFQQPLEEERSRREEELRRELEERSKGLLKF